MPESSSRERDLVLAPNEFAFISDQTKGNINAYVGPYKTSLANTDQPVGFNEQSKLFERCHLEQAIRTFATAPEGWYIVIKNPARDGNHPKTGTSNNLPELDIGRKVSIPGPVSFALWPGQMVRVIQGHHLRSNQYLLVRVYDEEAAKKNWKKAVIKPQTGASGDLPADESKPGSETLLKPNAEVEDITMGKLLVIKGTEVSFYIPPTGVEVVRDGAKYVRDAATLERLEFCILLDEDGNKRFIQGPVVVFPEPTETFVERNGSRKFKAIELNEISGIYVKVIAPYKENGNEYKVGEELFLTGKDQMIYFPRPEHAIIKYGDQEIHFSVAIPAGEGRYVLNRLTGKIALVPGPCMFLADPRKEVIVRRVLDSKIVRLWFPGNIEAIEYNASLRQLARDEMDSEFVTDREIKGSLAKPKKPASPSPEKAELSESIPGDDFNRKQAFTTPRTITLNTKYEGAVAIDVWTGYAILAVRKTGERKVIVGPKTHLLEYDESLEAMELSCGTPKTDNQLIKTGYLRVLYNKVSDIVLAETKDLCQVAIHLSYRVNFEGNPDIWFNVENYVKFLTDHMRSMLRNIVKQHDISPFYADAITVIRDTVLGAPVEDGKRTGRKFEENGMRIYDVEVLDVKIGDQTIEKLLTQAQHAVVQQNLQIAAEHRRLEFTEASESIKRKISETQTITRQQDLEIQTQEVKKQLLLNLAKIGSEIEVKQKTILAKLNEQESLEKINTAELARQKAVSSLELDVARAKLEQRLAEVKSEVEAVVDKAKAVSPDLIAAMQAFGDKALAERMAQSMAPLAILGGKSLADVFAQLLKGTPLENVLHKK